jgi:aminobenzoyl-glutamate utilization protein B
MLSVKKNVKDFIVNWNKVNSEVFYKTERQIWENPELPMQEFKSSALLMDLLESNGFTVDRGVAGMPTAFIASYGEGHPVIGINAEYDALPGLSQDADKLEKSPVIVGGPGHGCGHNLLGTGSVKAAIAIKHAIDEFGLKGTIKVIGAPAEELCLGKPYLGKAGCLDGFDAILDWHPWSYTKTNYDSCQAYFSVKFHFKGKTSHGNSPWHGRSALDAAMLQSHAVEMMREHMYPGCPPDAANTINFTFTTCGPEFASVVPDYTTAWYIGRFITTEEMLAALERVTKCAEAGAIATETEVEREIITVTHHKIPNKTLAGCFRNNMLEIGVPQFTEEEHEMAKAIQRELGKPETGLPTKLEPFEGGYTVLCDTSEYSWNAPYASPWIAMGMEDCGWHHWGVTKCAGNTMGQKSMDCAANVIAMTAADLLCDSEIVKKAKDEWVERMDGRVYECLLDEDMEPPVHMNADVMKKYI